MADPTEDTSSKGKRSSNTPRKRVSQACDRCRARKDKCDGQKPVCSTCASQDAVCKYDSNTKKRGLPEGYVRGIEKLWGLSIRQIENIEDDVVGVLSNQSTADVWNDVSTGSESLQETWRNSRISKELERLLPLLEIEDKSTKRKREGARHESFSENRASKSTPKSNDEGPATAIDQSPAKAASLTEDFTAPPAIQSPTHQISAGDAPRSAGAVDAAVLQPAGLPERTFRLIDIYFSYTHSWLPILEKYDVMRFSHQYSTLRAVPGDSSNKNGNHAVIWAVLAYADHQRLAFSDIQEPSSANMYTYARNLIPTEDGVFELGHVQALLILTLYNMGIGAWNKAWHLVGRASRIAIDLGLNQLETSTSKRSQHAFLGCFVLDTLVAARTNRRPQLRRDDLREDLNRLEEDGLEEWDPFNDALGVSTSTSRGPATILSTFNQLVRVIAMLNDIICVSPRADFLPYQNFEQDLKSMQHQLPSQFRPAWESKSGETASNSPILPHQYHLHMSYISTSATLYMFAKAAGYHLERSTEDIAASTIRQMAKLLKHHSQHFGLLILPPTYDYHTLIAGKCAYIDQNPLDDYRLDIQHSLSTMVKAWPTYESVDNLFTTRDLDTTPATTESKPAERPSFSAARPQSSQLLSSHRKDSFPDTFASLRSTTSNPQFAFPLVDLSMSNMQQQLSPNHSFDSSTPTAQSWAGITPGRENYPGSGVNLPLAPPSIFEGSGSIEVDGDSMFNEFATLDAMEWTNNWDQSLLNLGFTDPTSMNQDFYAFCREPDPLYPNDLVQQLLSNSNMAAGSRLSGDSGVRGFDMSGSMVNYSNPHVEASQILQALATAQDRSGQNGG